MNEIDNEELRKQREAELMNYIMSPDRDLSPQVEQAALRSSLINPNSDEVNDQVALRRLLVGGGGNKVPIFMPGGVQINTYDPAERKRRDEFAQEPYARALKQKELAGEDLQRMTQAQNVMDLQGARKMQNFQRIEAARKMAEEIRRKNEENDPNSALSQSAANSLNSSLQAWIDNYGGATEHPALIGIKPHLEAMKKNTAGKTTAQLAEMKKEAMAVIDDAMKRAGLDVSKYVGERNADAAAFNASTNRYRAENDADYKEFQKWKEAQEQKNKAEKSTADEKKAKMYLSAADEAEKSIEQAGKSHDPTSRLNFDQIPDALRGEDRKAYESSALSWLNNINYLRSGAAMGVEEAKNARREFFPTAGDSKEQIRIKAERRKKFAENTKKAFGIKDSHESVNSYTQEQETGISNLMNSAGISREQAIDLLKKNKKL